MELIVRKLEVHFRYADWDCRKYVQEKTKAKEAGKKMAEQPISLSISDAGKEQYRNSIQHGGQESYDAMLQRRGS